MSSEALERLRAAEAVKPAPGSMTRFAPFIHLDAADRDALLGEVARLEQAVTYANECGENMQGWAQRAEEAGRKARDELAAARAREQRLREAAQELFAAEGDEARFADSYNRLAALAAEPAATLAEPDA